MKRGRPQFVHRTLLSITTLLLGVALLLTTGCTAPPMESPSESAAPWAEGQPWRQADSSVLYTPDALQEMAWVGQSPDDSTWYDSRNDQLAGVNAGLRTRVVRQRSVTHTHTNLGTSNGRVYDNSYSHTYTRRVEELAR